MEQQQTTILIVDDEQKIRDIVRNYLEQEGFYIHTAAGGNEAISVLRASSIDLVLLDWMMPGMNGLECIRRIREFSDVPVIFLTAKSDEVDKLLGLELGADDYITKPFSMREMAARIRVVLRRLHKEQNLTASANTKCTIFERGNLRINLDKH